MASATFTKLNTQAMVFSSPKFSPSRSFSPSVLSVKRKKLMGSSISSNAISSPSLNPSTVVEGFDESRLDALGDVTLMSALTGEPVLIKDLWDQNEGIAVIALMRHFGCPCSWELASVLQNSKPQFDAAGIKLIAVGVGTPNKARLFAERLPFPLEYLYADPDRKAYDLLGLYYGFARTFLNPTSAKLFSPSRFKSLKEGAKNYTVAATPDDRSGILQQGGTFVFKGKQLLYAWKDKGTGDHAPLDEIFDVCSKVRLS